VGKREKERKRERERRREGGRTITATVRGLKKAERQV
jgi:hypothetical protein